MDTTQIILAIVWGICLLGFLYLLYGEWAKRTGQKKTSGRKMFAIFKQISRLVTGTSPDTPRPRVPTWLRRVLKVYFLPMALLITAVGSWGYFYQFPYFLCALSLLVLGIIHCRILYSHYIPWAKRSMENVYEDSFFSEFIYTFFITLLGGVGFTLLFLYFNKLPTWEISFMSFIFLLPFLLLKMRDYAYQISFDDYEIKWHYPITDIDLNKMHREEGQYTVLKFHFVTDFAINKEEIIWVKSPLNETLGVAFKMGITGYNNEAHISKKANNLGYHRKDFRIAKQWWLFYKKRFLIKNIALNPNTKIVEFVNNGILKEGDHIYVERQFLVNNKATHINDIS